LFYVVRQYILFQQFVAWEDAFLLTWLRICFSFVLLIARLLSTVDHHLGDSAMLALPCGVVERKVIFAALYYCCSCGIKSVIIKAIISNESEVRVVLIIFVWRFIKKCF
jgi:hypothetical protein